MNIKVITPLKNIVIAPYIQKVQQVNCIGGWLAMAILQRP